MPSAEAQKIPAQIRSSHLLQYFISCKLYVLYPSVTILKSRDRVTVARFVYEQHNWM